MNKNWIKGLCLAAVAAVAALSSVPAQAGCPNSIILGIDFATPNCGGTYCYIQSPGAGNQTTVEATFWAFGNGNPATGLGVDNGGFNDSGWLSGPYPGGLGMSADWGGTSAALIDGCIETTGTVANQRQVVQFSDVNATGSASFLAIACVARVPADNFQFNLARVNQNIVLKAIPKAAITSSVRVGNEAQITVGSPDFSGLVYTDGSTNCNVASLIPQYEVWLKSVARNAPAPTDRDAESGGWTLGNTCAIGSSCTATSACGATNCDVYVSVSPKYNSGMPAGETNASPRISPNSTLVQAGPTLAEPPNFKIVPKKTAPTRGIKK